MIFGEGLVFGLALIIGIWLIYKSYNQTLKNEKNKSNFLLAVTHELKSPLTAISLNLQTIRRSKSISEQGLGNLSLAESETNRLNLLIENLLHSAKSDFSEIKNRQHVDLDKLIAQVISDFGQDIKYTITGSKQPVYVSKISIETILKNLIENALKFSNNPALIHIATTYNTDNTKVAITDNADIIPIKERANIFAKFYRLGDENTRKTKGVGLGLYLVDKLIKEIGGSIAVSKHNSGNIFTITIPNA